MGFRISNIKTLSSVADAVTDLESPIDLTIRLQEILTDWEKLANRWMHGDMSEYLSLAPFASRFISSIMREYEISNDRLPFGDKYTVWRGRKTVLINYLVDGTFDLSDQDTELKNFERYLFSRVHGSQNVHD
jgi:hypothetical protein